MQGKPEVFITGISMSEATPYSSLDIANLRNVLLSSVPSPLHCYGDDEVQLEILKGSMQVDNLISGHFHSNGLNMESRVFNNDNQLDKGVCTVPMQSHPLISNIHQPESLNGISSSKDITQQSLLLVKSSSSSQHEGVSGHGRKRPFEHADNLSLCKKMKCNSTSKIALEPQWHQAREASELIPGHKLHVPVKRTQKLSDKITILQKLVSPFGKTDTASVLHEASLYIKLLQSQIRTLFQMLSCSYISTARAPHNQECEDKLQVDLRNRGLCLVPISITHKVGMEDQIHHDSTSRTILPGNF